MLGNLRKWRVIEAFGFHRVGQIIERDDGAARPWIQRGYIEPYVETAEVAPPETACKRPMRRRGCK